MNAKKRFLSLFLSMCVVATLMFQSVHTYTHLVTEYFGIQNTQHSKTDKAIAHNADNCQVCHFTFSPFTPMSFSEVVFFTNSIYQKLNAIYHFDFVEVAFDYFSLRAPPVMLK